MRALLSSFPEIGSLEAAGDAPGLGPETFERLRLAARARAEGASDDEIRRLLAAPPAGATHAEEEASAAAEAGRTPDVPADLAGTLASIQEALARGEERRASDHDRLMMALIRAQQEIQHLRYELAASSSRRNRRRGLLSRLFRSGR